jgi:hypothetical protein
MGIGSWPRRGLHPLAGTSRYAWKLAVGGRLRDGETLDMPCMQGFLRRGFGYSERGICPLIGEGYAGVQQVLGLRAEGIQSHNLGFPDGRL